MDIEYVLHGIRFRWNADKARKNIDKHQVSFEQAAEVFLDPFVRYHDASDRGEQRDAAIGADFDFRVLFVVHRMFEDDYIRIISARKAEPPERSRYENGND
ncbi:MAG: BrnT family toxin [Thiomonas sp.]